MHDSIHTLIVHEFVQQPTEPKLSLADAAAARDRRASVRHHQSVGGCDALQDQDAPARRHRDGAAHARLQSEARDRDPWHAAPGWGHNGFLAWLAVSMRPNIRLKASWDTNLRELSLSYG